MLLASSPSVSPPMRCMLLAMSHQKLFMVSQMSAPSGSRACLHASVTTSTRSNVSGVSSTTNWYACVIALRPPVCATSINIERLNVGTVTTSSPSVT